MARSEIREDQVKDDDFLSPWEHDHEAHHYFIRELDTPTTYSGYAGKYVRVDTTASGLIFSDVVLEENWQKISSNYTASVGDCLFLDSTVSGIVITLPSNPSMGNKIKFIDGPGNCSTNNVTISGAGQKIFGNNDDLIVDEDDAYFALVYYNSSVGWKLGV